MDDAEKADGFGEGSSRRKKVMAWMVVSAIAVAAIIVVVVLLVTRDNDDEGQGVPYYGGGGGGGGGGGPIFPPQNPNPNPNPPSNPLPNPNPNPNPPPNPLPNPNPSPNPPTNPSPNPNPPVNPKPNPPPANPAPNPNPPANPNPPGVPSPVSDTIKYACSDAMYKKSCISSLSSYPGASQANLSSLATISIQLSLSQSQKAASSISDLHSKSNDQRNREALEDCMNLFNDTMDQLGNSMDKLQHLTEDSFASDIADVQTWLSAALTDPDTCVEGFQETNKNMVPVMAATTEQANEAISNSLAVINKLAASRLL